MEGGRGFRIWHVPSFSLERCTGFFLYLLIKFLKFISHPDRSFPFVPSSYPSLPMPPFHPSHAAVSIANSGGCTECECTQYTYESNCDGLKEHGPQREWHY